MRIIEVIEVIYSDFVFYIRTHIGAVMLLIKAHPNKFIRMKNKTDEKSELYSWTGIISYLDSTTSLTSDHNKISFNSKARTTNNNPRDF